MSSGERARPAAATDGAAPTERERRVPTRKIIVTSALSMATSVVLYSQRYLLLTKLRRLRLHLAHLGKLPWHPGRV